MGAVKAWLMEMRDYAYDCMFEADLDLDPDLVHAEQKFVKKYPNQSQVFWNAFEELKEPPDVC